MDQVLGEVHTHTHSNIKGNPVEFLIIAICTVRGGLNYVLIRDSGCLIRGIGFGLSLAVHIFIGD